MTVTFTIPEEARVKDSFIEDEDYRISYVALMNDPDLYRCCGTDVNGCEVEGMTPNDKLFYQ